MQRNQRSNCRNPVDHRESKRVPEKHLLLLYWFCHCLWLCRSQHTVENYKRYGNTRPSDLPMRNLHAGQEAKVRTRHGTINWLQVGKGEHQGCTLSPTHLIYIRLYHTKCQAGWSTSWNQVCWDKYQSPHICRWHHPYGEKWRTKEPLDESQRGEWKFGLKFNIQKTNIMAPGSITSWQIDGETVETVTGSTFLGSKITAAMKYLWLWN